MRSLDHENVVKLEGIISYSEGCNANAGADFNIHMYMVFEYAEHDLNGVLHNQAVQYSHAHIKCLVKQMMTGLKHLHERDIIHRDIKGSNLLLNAKGELKIADFGLARNLIKDPYTRANTENQDLTNRVVTIWYRSPELLLGAHSYTFAIDIWSAGLLDLI